MSAAIVLPGCHPAITAIVVGVCVASTRGDSNNRSELSNRISASLLDSIDSVNCTKGMGLKSFVLKKHTRRILIFHL